MAARCLYSDNLQLRIKQATTDSQPHSRLKHDQKNLRCMRRDKLDAQAQTKREVKKKLNKKKEEKKKQRCMVSLEKRSTVPVGILLISFIAAFRFYRFFFLYVCVCVSGSVSFNTGHISMYLCRSGIIRQQNILYI